MGSHRAAKGNQVKIPEPGQGTSLGGDAKELRDVGGSPKEGSLLFLTIGMFAPSSTSRKVVV